MTGVFHLVICWLIAVLCLIQVMISQKQQVNATPMAESKEFMTGRVIRVGIIHVS
jgi:hypothetical protein